MSTLDTLTNTLLKVSKEYNSLKLAVEDLRAQMEADAMRKIKLYLEAEYGAELQRLAEARSDAHDDLMAGRIILAG